MRNNSTLSSTSHSSCNINWKTVEAVWLYIDITTSVASIVGNILIIVIVCRMKTRLRTTTNYFIANMSLSDVFVPAMSLLNDILISRKDAGYLSQTTGTALCRFFIFFINVTYEVSMLSLVTITVHRFYAVAFPMRARVQSKRTRIILLIFTWIIPIVMSSPVLSFFNFALEDHSCKRLLSKHQSRIYDTILILFFFALPLLIMLVLYPVIIVKLRRQKIPGNTSCPQALIRRRKQNFRLTTMFITIAVAFILTWGINQVLTFISLFPIATDLCTFINVSSIVIVLPIVFHAINPLIYFIFCSSYRQGIKQIFSCCCCRHTHVHNAPVGDQVELDNIPQA